VVTTGAAWQRRALLRGAPWKTGRPAARTGELVVARRAMACEFSVVLPGSGRDALPHALAALDEVDRVEQRLSVYRGESDLSLVNRAACQGRVDLDPELASLLRHAGSLHDRTRGAFDPASGALVRAWGFAGGARRVPTDVERAAARAASGWRHVHLDEAGGIWFDTPGLELNLGAIGKGYAIDRALERLRKGGVACALVQGGRSSLRALGEPPGGWPVAIGDPRHPGATVARLRLRERALGTTAADNQFLEAHGRRYGHVLDPRTAWPAEALLGASATAPSATEADALSTAFFVMGIAATRAFCDEHAAIGAVLVSPDDVVVLGAATREVTT
jgi:thiamine biosynthesis lipoprotein